MNAGEACGQLTDPLSLSVWMKMEQCILLVGYTSNIMAFDRADNDNNVNNNDDVNDVENNDNFEFWVVSIQNTIYRLVWATLKTIASSAKLDL